MGRPLIYTGVTRAERLCVIVGVPRYIGLAARQADDAARQTRLRDRLAARP